MLLKFGADPALGCNDIGIANSCVHAATMENDAASLSLLLRYGASAHAAGKGGFTPLALASRSGAVPAATLLLAAGADPDAPTPMGKTSRAIAMANNRSAILEAFGAAPKP